MKAVGTICRAVLLHSTYRKATTSCCSPFVERALVCVDFPDDTALDQGNHHPADTYPHSFPALPVLGTYGDLDVPSYLDHPEWPARVRC